MTDIDSSSSLTAMCRDRFPRHEWLVADMRNLALDRRFHGLIAWDSFFHLTPDDQRSMLEVFRSHAQPNAA
ncbi:class I SAM-dependent methyltransferase [Rhizobium bangladeshense]|uniref:class I SAM-dependent methyltransferase n=1 Tax=Rhizobium bangladeshense TaxID=1138189 RepID=UPI0012E98FEF|nr:class I SAM-dependent methyltransferase [Rhizobium bangladeshense]